MLDVQPLSRKITVKVANGQVLNCEHHLSKAEWYISTYKFRSDLIFVQLPSVDLVVGMDWLQAYSPMEVDWYNKWMAIPYHGHTICIQGVQSSFPTGAMIELRLSMGDMKTDQIQTTTEKTIDPRIQVVLSKFADLFSEPVGLPPSRHCDHSIPLVPGANPFTVRPYRYPPALKDEIEKQVQEMLAQGVIQKSRSPFASPVLLVKKKDRSWRFCVDYRYLNAMTAKSKYPVPIFDQLMDELVTAKWFSKLDLRAGYHQIRLLPGEEPKTAFQTHMGHFEFRVMAFGLTGAPNTFLDAMNTTLAPVLRKCALVFFDDILIYSPTFESHIAHLNSVLQLLQQDQWKVKLSKCAFAQTSISYLGHIISDHGIATDPAKILVVKEWPIPTSTKELRGFLGLAGFYRKFVRHFGMISRPLTDLLKKNTVFVWTSEHQQAFELLKDALSSAPVLALPDFSAPFCIYTDACKTGIGAVLMQKGHPLAFLSKALGPKNQGLSAYEKEYLAIIIAVGHWRSYLQLAEFQIFTDHQSLVQLNEQRLHTIWQQKLYSKLAGLQYRIVYKKGSDNVAADALSRYPGEAQVFHISQCTPTWVQEVIQHYQNDPVAQELLVQLAVTASNSSSPFTLTQGIIRYKGRVWLGNNLPLQSKVISALHDSAIGGHSGFPVTYKRIKQLFYWKGMKSDILKFVQTCGTCQQAKPDRSRYPGLLSPLPIPPHAWHSISMDFIEGLPKSGSMDCILVVVDRFSKYSHFLALSHPFSAAKVAKLFLDNIYKLHGMPDSIVSDRDRVFTSNFWQQLFTLTGTQLCMSSAYHPQSDGQTERVNQCIETYLRCFVHACPNKWSLWLSVTEFWYNTNFHSAVGRSPFEVLYGHSPRHFGLQTTEAVLVAELTAWLQEREVISNLVRQHLLRAQARMKRQADKQRSEREFSVGDQVYLKLQPYVQSSVTARSNQKLSFRFFGPYVILERIGQVAYKLKLPESALIHPVFHVSQLKSALGRRQVVVPHLPFTNDPLQVPVQVVDRRMIQRNRTMIAQVKVVWSGMDAELATWEDAEALYNRFPRAPAWGQAVIEERGNVSTKGEQALSEEERSGEGRQREEESKRARIRRRNVRLCGPEWAM